MHYVIQQILYESILFRFDGAFHFKASKKHYGATELSTHQKVSRKGIWSVLVFYMIYIIVLLLLKINHLLSWSIYLAGACFVLFLNNLFIYFKCPIQEYLLKDVTCCANCHISAWDYYIFATGLLFAPLSGIYIYIMISLFFIALIRLISWEVTILRYPERFSPNTNASITCQYCQKNVHV